MAKRSKKKNPNRSTIRQREVFAYNNALQTQQKEWQLKLNITIAVVVAVLFISFILLPVVNLTFSSADLNGAQQITDEPIELVVNMSFLDILTALAGGYEDSISYIANNNNMSFSASIIEGFIRKSITQEDIDGLDMAYVVSLVVAIIMLISMVLLLIAVSILRRNKKDNIWLALSIFFMSIMSIVQWILYVAIGIQAMGRGQIQPHIGSYLTMFAGITMAVVYIIFKSRMVKLAGKNNPLSDNKTQRKA